MREIGIVKWFGGYNRQIGQENDFGYIQRENKPDIKVYRAQVRCSESDLQEGVFVTFEVGINPRNGREVAHNLRLYKEVGKFTRFGTSNHKTYQENNYAFIECEGRENVQVHRKEISCLESALQEGTLVKFDLIKYKNRYRARNLHLLNLEKETDSDIIERFLNHSDPRFCALGFWGYVNDKSIAEGVSLAEKKLKTFLPWQKRRFLHYLPPSICFSLDKRNARGFLPYDRQLELCIQMLPDDLSTEINAIEREEIFNIIAKLKDVDFRICDKLPKKLYSLYVNAPKKRKSLNVILHVKCLVELISDIQNQPERSALLTELQERLIEPKNSRLWGIITDEIIQEEQLWIIAPRNRRIRILVSQLGDRRELNTQDKILAIAEVLEESEPEEIESLISILQNRNWVKEHEAILRFLPAVEQVNILIAKLTENLGENPAIISQIAQVLTVNSSENHPKLLSLLPDNIKEWDEIFRFLPSDEKVSILLAKLKAEGQSEEQENIVKLGSAIAEVSQEERIVLIYRLPKWLIYKEPILNLLYSLPPEEQVNIVCCYLIESGSLSIWRSLSRQAKILCIYRFAKESKDISIILSKLSELQKNNPEKDYLVRNALKLLWAKEHPERGNEVFQQVHELLTQYVIEQAKSSTEFLELDPLLPYCQPTEVSVKYCEGKLWKTKEGTCAYCPRTRKRCELFEPNKRGNSNSDLYGARIYAQCSQDWRNWSLLELFKLAGIEPSLPGLKIPEDYVPKLAGWINRINEIRSRLKCSVCKEIMPHNIEYAKFTAQFRVTVFSCKHGSGHDHNIYLNECWGCGEIIDSRESKYQSAEDKYYICIHCGSGTQHSNSYTQGDICPKCGTLGMEVNKWNNRYRKCHSCNHLIKLPDEKKLTGPKCSKCGTKGMILLVNQNNEQIRGCRSQSCELSINLFTEQRVAEPQQWENDINF